MATTNLIFYNSAKPSSVLLMAEYYYKNHVAGNTLTIKDVVGLNTATLTTYCASTLVDATYTEILIACACESTAQSTADATLNLANQYALLAKIITDSQGTLSDAYAAASTHTATTIGLSTITAWTTNSVVGTQAAPVHVVLTAGTGASQLSMIKSNTTTVATIYGTFYAVPDGTTTFKTLTGANLFIAGQAQSQSATVTKNRSELGWGAMYPGITLPVINSYFAGVPGYALYTGTATSACGAATATDSALGATTDQWAGYWLVVYDASAYGYQYGQILSNTSTVITLTANWGLGTPTGTGKILRIYAREVDCLKDICFQLWMMTNLTAVNSNSTQLANLTKLIDQNGALANSTAFKQTSQDLDYLSKCLVAGKHYLDYIHGNWTIMVPGT